MASILTNSSAMSALSTLRSIASNMESTQNAISTGMKVSKASDNAAYWSISTIMKSDNMALGAVTDALGVGAAKVDTAYAGMESAIDVMKEIKAKVVAAKEEGVDKAKIQEEIVQLKEQLVSIAKSSSFNGENWLAADADATKTVVSGFVRDASNNVSVKTTDYALNDTSLLFKFNATTGATETGGILNTAGNVTVAGASVGGIAIDALDVSGDDLDVALASVDAALDKMTSAGAKLGSISSRIDLQTDFSSKLSDAIEKGVGRLVDADMNEESTRLKALQTQQQLAIQALSIANNDSQNILSLFR
ncbi:flagellin N-terminal helical domain-containing protein [Rhizobium rosettiformans]|uniref:flagellin N-terminal helical domain-containing protein n=1 Tax=Rhizobium rosettiformans TaxID=1368430 RepID=UPI0028671E47|nr:flagellin [Rhizobium rosettiformans]MDR7028581.1 flagellin [Rhizobium rosettiformans]MDR7064137.1 flagellin [Rhizobium rosettiformans]